MDKLLDLAHTPPRYERIVPDPHRLTVYDHPDDGMHVDHPDSCPREIVTFPSGFTWTAYHCVVQWHLDGVGTDGLYRHAFDEPYHDADWREPLLPGIYTFHYEVTIWPQHRSMWDDSVPDEEIEAVSQAALPSVESVINETARQSPWAVEHWLAAYDQAYGRVPWRWLVESSIVIQERPDRLATAVIHAMDPAPICFGGEV